MRVVFIGVIFVGIGLFSAAQSVKADSISSDTAFRCAQTAAREIIGKIEGENKDGIISNLSEECSSGQIEGRNPFGEWSAIFFGGSSLQKLSCSDKVSSATWMEVTGFFGGVSRTIRVEIFSAEEVFRCVGERSENTKVFEDDESGLIENMPWLYSEKGTSRKCEYACSSGFAWSGDACVEISAVDGVCGSAAREYTALESAFSGTLCSIGTPSPLNPRFPSAGESVSWQCLGSGNGKSDSCTAKHNAPLTPNACSLITTTSVVPEGYGSPFNMLSERREPTLVVSCGENETVATAGNASLQTFVYESGFVLANGLWERVSFGKNGTPDLKNKGWYKGAVSSDRLPLAVSGRKNFVIAFICQYQNNAWKCGCRDSACAQNYWTIQMY